MLEQSDKIERFAEVINRNAGKKCKKIEKQTEEFRKKELAALKKQSANELESRLEFEVDRLNKETNREFSALQRESRKKIVQRRDEITEEIYLRVKSRLADFTQTNDYLSFLEKSISLVCDRIDANVIVFVCERDLEKVKNICAKLDAVSDVKVSSQIKLGGIIAYSEDMSVSVNDTLDDRLARSRESFMESSGLGLSAWE